MSEAQAAAVALLGPVRWVSETEGLCRCPGERMHNAKDGAKDCRVMLDGAPTIYCFHSSCEEDVALANLRLRRMLPSSGVKGVARVAPEVRARKKGDAVVEDARGRAREKRQAILDQYAWPLMEMMEDNPVMLAELSPEEQFRAWLRIWPPHSVVWIGDIYSSGKPEHATHFRTVGEWERIGPVMGNFTCGSGFKAGSIRRGNESVTGERFLVVESDVLGKDEVGAVFAWMVERLRYRMHCVIDTGGKSLHGWFDAPLAHEEARLEAALEGLGCDPKVFTYSQPVRVPGAMRDGKLQQLVWLRD